MPKFRTTCLVYNIYLNKYISDIERFIAVKIRHDLIV